MEFFIILTIKSTLVILLASVLLLVLKRKSATLRHWVISLTMIGLLALPLFIEGLPNVTVEVPYLANQTIQKAEPIPNQAIIKKKIIESTIPRNTKLAIPAEVNTFIEDTPATINNNVLSRSELVFDQPEEAVSNSTLTIPLPTLISFIWLLGCAYFFIKFLLGIYQIWAITRKSHLFPIPTSIQLSILPILPPNVQFLINSTIKTPMTWGAFRPVILLPTAALDWSNSELQAVLVHELSHIKKGDYWIHTIGLLSVCLYWYNPLIWWMKKQQVLEREKACDESVLLSGIPQQNYAEQLIQITRRLSQRSTIIIGENALPMAKVSQIKKRVVAILNFEDRTYQFSKEKQWKWGIFYSCLFPIIAALSPIGQRVIQDHFPLVPLETITQYLDTKKLSTAVSANIFLTKKVSTNKDTKTVNDLHLLPNDLVKTKPNNEWVVPQSLQPIPSFLSSSSLLSTISVNLDNRQPRLMGEWREGSSEFTIWTYGEIKILDTAPYFDIISPDGIIFIEEYINGIFRGKVNQLTIAKATTNVIERPKLGKEIDPAATVIKKGELIKIWSNNKSFLFFTKNMDKWIMDKVKNIASSFESKKQDNIIQEIPVTNQEWRTKVQRTRDFIDFIFMPTEEVEEQVERKQKRENLNLDAIPFKQIPVPVNTDVSQTWGRQIPIEKLYSGLKGISPIGKKFTTLIQGGKEAVVLKDLNFHLGVNTFKKLEFELTLYQVVDGNIKHAIIQEPIPISISEGAGWIQKDLSNYNIVSQGDIYVVLENIGFSGAKRGKTLYLSVSADSGSYEPVLKESTVLSKKFWERNFWELPFTMNVTTAGPSPVTSSTPKIKNTSQQKTSDPTLREQIHARLVNLHQVTDNNENFAGYEGLKEAIGDAEIIMLGEQSHGEATTYQTKIKLIKYLHQEMGFDILAFESSLYECDRAWSMIEEGQNVKNTLAKSIFFIWSIVQEFSPLYDYIEKQLGSERPLRVAGFDHQIAGTIGQDYFVADLTSYIHTFKDASVYQYQLEELKTFLAFGGSKRMKGYNKKRATASIAFLQELQELIKSKPSDGQSSFWLLNIKNLELFISDTKLGTDTRDKQMANNLVWLKEKYPNKKIICWGATSHFLYNSSEIKMDKLLPQVLAANYYKKHSMMGDYIKEKYGDKVYTIGFTAYEGKTANKKLKPPPANSLEFLIGSADADNYFLPLEGLSLENYMSRPLGNLYMTTDIATVIDGVIFNRHMKQPYTDWDFFMELVPENKYVPKKIDRLKEYQRKNKLKEDQ